MARIADAEQIGYLHSPKEVIVLIYYNNQFLV